MPINIYIYMMELLSKNELDITELGYIRDVITGVNPDYEPVIEPLLVLPPKDEGERNSICRIRINKRIKDDDLLEINQSLVSLNLNAKVKEAKEVLILEGMPAGEGKMEKLSELIDSEFKYKYGIELSGELNDSDKDLLEQILWAHAGAKIAKGNKSRIQKIEKKDYGYKIYLNYKLSNAVVNELNEELKVIKNFRQVLYKSRYYNTKEYD